MTHILDCGYAVVVIRNEKLTRKRGQRENVITVECKDKRKAKSKKQIYQNYLTFHKIFFIDTTTIMWTLISTYLETIVWPFDENFGSD